MSARPLVFGSLYSGCAGFDLGLEQAGFVCAFQVEIDPSARAVLAHHWPATRRHDDARTFPPSDPSAPCTPREPHPSPRRCSLALVEI
jgi:site-specific DNA-cytosine methylase